VSHHRQITENGDHGHMLLIEGNAISMLDVYVRIVNFRYRYTSNIIKAKK